MKKRILYEGTVGEYINDALPIMISKAKELEEDVFLRWNGATLRITKEDTIEGLLKEYDEQLHAITLLEQEKRGDLLGITYIKEKIANVLVEFLMK